MVYATWALYKTLYGGDVVPEENFVRYAGEASRWLDMLAFGRIDAAYAQSEMVQMACCAAADVLWDAAQDGGQAVARERLDNYEVAYAGGRARLRTRVLDAVRPYLWRTGLLAMAVQRWGG